MIRNPPKLLTNDQIDALRFIGVRVECDGDIQVLHNDRAHAAEKTLRDLRAKFAEVLTMLDHEPRSDPRLGDLRRALEELDNIRRNQPVWPGDTISHRGAVDCVRRGWAKRNENGDFVLTDEGPDVTARAGIEL